MGDIQAGSEGRLYGMDMHSHPQLTPHPELAPRPQSRSDRFARVFLKWYEHPTWLAPLAVLACAGAVAGYTLAVDRSGPAVPTCAVRLLTGFDCPGCGGTRALWFLLHGDLPEAARYNLAAVFAVPFLVWFFVAWSVNRMFNTRLPVLKINPVMVGVFLAMWGVFAVLRNLPWEPFTLFYV